MRVKNIHWISITSKEAEVEVTDGHFNCTVFSQPCDVAVGDALTEPMHILNMRNAQINTDSPPSIKNTRKNTFEHKVVGVVNCLEEQIISVGKIILIADDYLPGGLKVGDKIEFECGRIDLW